MAVDRLPGRVREFANYLNGLLGRLDQGGGWCAVFWQRDPDGMRACRDGREMPPWDLVEALLQDLAAAAGPGPVAREREHARALHAAAVAAYDARPGGRDALGDRLDVMLREQRYAAERLAELGRALASAVGREEADALRIELAWARDDHERATARCAELRGRMDAMTHRATYARTGPPGATARTAADGGGRGDAGTATGGTVFGPGPAPVQGAAAFHAGAGAGAGAGSAGGAARHADARSMEGAASGAGFGVGAGPVEGAALWADAGPAEGVAFGTVSGSGEGIAFRTDLQRTERADGQPPRHAEARYPERADAPSPRRADARPLKRTGVHPSARPVFRIEAQVETGVPADPGASGGGLSGVPQRRDVRAGSGGAVPRFPGPDRADAEAFPGRLGSPEAWPAEATGAAGASRAAEATGGAGGAGAADAPGGAGAAGAADAPGGAGRAGAAGAPGDGDAGAGPRSPGAASAATAPPRQPSGDGVKARKRRRGSARFAGMADEDAAPVTVPPATVPAPSAPDAAGARTPRGARFAGAAEADQGARGARAPQPQPEPVDAEAAREVAAAVESLLRLHAEGRSGEAHMLLFEAAYWPPARFPLLAAELRRAGLGADWATLLWEAASLPADRLVAAADALVAAGRPADGEQILRQGVVRPATEIGEAVLGLVAEGRRREVRALLDAYVRVRTPEEAVRSVEPDPPTLAPLLLQAAQGVSDERRWDLVHAFRVAGLAA
ncbi:hypothetical protein [Streptomyces sp. NPDC020996]|uniref:hypothetical protein n=1 Tax=Streptomyces sp. NPDC020996 TaxID=3154791 RepID=UPI0033CAE7A2